MRVLPGRDGDPALPSFPGANATAAEVVGCAETLGIPWVRLIRDEIEAEQRLRRHIQDVDADCPLDSALDVLAESALRSWRVRDRVEALAIEARMPVRGAAAALRRVVRRLAGESDTDSAALVRHCRFAYDRILLLQRVRRAAARSRGTLAERLAYVCSTARCAFEDAEWALREEGSPRRGRRMEAAVRKVREEGFLVPRAPTEARSLAELRKLVSATRRTERRVRPLRYGFRETSPRIRSAGAS